MKNLLHVHKFSIANTKQTLNKTECKLEEKKYNWFTSFIVRVANKIAQVFGAKTITQQNLSTSIQHACHFIYKNKIDLELACEVKLTISQIKHSFNEYLSSSKGAKDLDRLRHLDYSIDLTIDDECIDDTESDTPLNKAFIGISANDYLSDDAIAAMCLLDNETSNEREEEEIGKAKKSNNYTYFLEGNSMDEIRLKRRVYK